MDAKQLAAALRKRLALSPPVIGGLPKALFKLFVDRAADWIVAGSQPTELPLFRHDTLLKFAQQLEAKGKLPKTKRTSDDPDDRKKQLAGNISAALTDLTKRLRDLPFAQSLDPDGDNFLLSFAVALGTERIDVQATGLLPKNRSGFDFPDDPRIGLLARTSTRMRRPVEIRRVPERAVAGAKRLVPPPMVNVVYAKEDLELRRRLEKHVSVLEQSGIVTVWKDRLIASDQQTISEPELSETAAVVVLLVSPALAQSGYFSSSEFLDTLHRYENARVALVPILTSTFEWRVGALASVELPVRDELAIALPLHADDALNSIAAHIRSLMDQAAEQPLKPALLWNLPQQRNLTFTGRDMLFSALESTQIVDGNGLRVDVLTGLGGIGKSHVSIELAYRVSDACDVIWWVRGSDETTLQADYRALAVALFLADPSTPTPEAVARARSWLEENGKWMLIVDNAETPASLQEYLPRVGGGRVVITSLNPAWRTVGTIHEIEPFSEAEAISFLQRRSGVTAPGASDLAEQLGYLPLALEHAAAYIDAVGTDYASYLALYRAHRRQLLREHDSHLSPVVTTWQISIDRVKKENSLAVDLLNLAARMGSAPIPRAVFEYWAGQNERFAPRLGNAPFAIAETWGGYKKKTPIEISNAVKALRRYSLVNARSADIVVHRLLQECICSNAEEKEDNKFEGTALGVIHRLFQNETFNYHHSELATALLPHVRVVTTPERLATSTDGVHLLTMLARYLDEHGSYSEAASILKEAERRCDRGKVDRFIALTVRTKLAAVYRVMRRPEDAFAAIGRAGVIAEKLFPLISDEDFVVMTEFLNTAAVLATEGRAPDLAVSLLQRALGILKDRDFMPGIVALTHANLGSALGKLGRHDEAIEQLKLATERDRLAFDNSHPIVAQRLGALGTAYRDAGRLPEARGAFYEAWQIHVAAHGEKHPVTLFRLANVAQVDLMLGNAQAAFESYDQALAMALTVGLRTSEIAALRNQRAMSLEQLGQFDEALAEIDTAIALARDGDSRFRTLCEGNRQHILESAALAARGEWQPFRRVEFRFS